MRDSSQAKLTKKTIKNIDYQIRRTNRLKTYEINIRNGEVFMNVPKDMSARTIHQAILEHEPWVSKQLKALPLHLRSSKPRLLKSGSRIDYKGQTYRLQLIRPQSELYQDYQQGLLLFDDNCFQLTVAKRVKAANLQSYLNKKLETWFKDQALHELTLRTQYHAKKLRLKPKAVHIRSYKARWGCCAENGEITFDWKLLKTPEHIRDYVIIHELCHLKHFNHSPQFWQLVGKYYPDYKNAEAWLKQNQAKLARF